MKLLGIDYGSKRIGLAWSDTTLGMVLPFGTIEVKATKTAKFSQKERLVAKLLECIATERPDMIVLGLPLGLSGQENANTKRIQELAFEITKHTGLAVEFADERFSSQQADAVGGGVSRDERAAMIILQSFLDKKK